jgi:hypothetical protein
MNLFKRTTASVALVALVSGVFSTGVSAYDVAELNAAQALAAKGYINTQSDAAGYALDNTITRAEIAKVAANVAELAAAASCEGKFADVSATTPNDWVCGYVEALLANGLISANANYNPNANLTKAEAVKLMLTVAGEEVSYDAATWQADFVSYAVENGFVSTFSDYNTAATRGFVFSVAAAATTEDEGDDILSELDKLLGGDDEDEETTMDEDEEETTVVSGDSELMVELSPETPSNGTVAAGVTRTPVLAFDVTAGSEDSELKEATLEFTGLGDASDIDNLAFYIGNDKVTKQDSRSFDSENEARLSFEKDTVIKAGETKTIVVTATIDATAANELQTLRVSLMELEASTSVEGDELDGANLTPVAVTNKAGLDVNQDTASDDVVVGEVVTLAGFEVEETTDKEDITVLSVTFTVSGSIDAEDDITDLELLADGEVVASNLVVNSDDEIIVDLDVTVPADDEVEFELRGVVTGSINETIEIVFENTDDIYAVGATTGISLESATDITTLDLADIATVEGSEINVSFDKSSVDEVKPNAEDVLVGTLTMSTDEDYTIEVITVTVDSTTNNVEDIIAEFELDGTSYDTLTNGNSTSATYTFEDISLNDEEKVLDLTFEVEDNVALNGDDLEFTVSITSVTDETNDEKYTSNVNDVLSSNSFDSKTLDIESATFELTASNVTDRELVLGNGIEVVLYKGKLSVGDSDNVTIKEFNFNDGATSLSNSADLEDILDTVTLNIGGKTFDGDIEATTVDFKSVNAEIEAGADNVEVLLTGILKDDDSIVNGDVLELAFDVASLELEDSEGEDLEAGNITTAAANTYNPNLTLNEEGTFNIAVINNGDNEDDIEPVVLAGTNSVALAEVSLEAEDEDIKVKELAFTIAGADFTSTLENVKLVAGSTTLAEGAVVTYDTTDTFITFKNDFIIEESMDEIEAVLVADLNTVTTEGGEVSANLGDIAIELVSYSDENGGKAGVQNADVKGVSSNEEVAITETGNVTADTVTVVPALVTVSVISTLGNEENDAKIRFDIDKGNNDLDSDDVVITQVQLETAIASGVTIRNDDNTTITITDNTLATLALTADNEINDGDEYEFSVSADNDEVRILANGITFTIDGNSYTISNDKVIDLGEYTTE